MSPTTRRSRDEVCPFYMADTPLAINCEGPFDGCRRVQLLFCGMDKNEMHIREFCCKHYSRRKSLCSVSASQARRRPARRVSSS